MNYYLKSFILVIAVSFSLVVNGQVNYKKGFVITNNNDTLFGRIDDRGGYRNAKVCVFKAKKQPLVRYTPQDIKAYQMLGDKYYVSRRVYVRGKYRDLFIDVLLKGDVSLYHNWKNKDLAYYIEKKDKEMVGLINEEVMLRYKPEGNVAVLYSPTYVLSNKIFRDTLRSVFSDSKKIQDRVQDVEYDPKSLTNITKAYINEMCKGKDCISYERNLRKNSPRFGVFAGVQLNQLSFLPSVKGMYSTEEPSTIVGKDFYANPLGIFVNFPMHLINDRLSFQIEGIYTERLYKEQLPANQNFTDRIEINTHSIGIPLLLKYQIGHGFISPTFAIGKETTYVYESKVKIEESLEEMEKMKDFKIHPVQKGGWLGEVGLNFKLAEHLTLFSNLRYQTGKNLILVGGNERASYSTVVNSSDFVKEYKTNFTTLLVGLKF
ncbi:MAG TPA: outer membrane beta-barrel protein [Prolixibacteraceae bacterium]